MSIQLIVKNDNNASEGRLRDLLYNHENLEFIGSHAALDGLQSAVETMARRGSEEPSRLWAKLINAGAAELFRQWRSTPDTNVGAVYGAVMAKSGVNSGSLHVVFEAFTSQSLYHHSCDDVMAFVRDDVLATDAETGEPWVNLCGDWGFEFGDFCCLAAAIALKQTWNARVFVDYVDEVDTFIRRKVWLARALLAFGEPFPEEKFPK